MRKKKLIPSYDLEARVGWEGTLTDGDGNVVGTATGKLHLPHIGGARQRSHAESVAVTLAPAGLSACGLAVHAGTTPARACHAAACGWRDPGLQQPPLPLSSRCPQMTTTTRIPRSGARRVFGRRMHVHAGLPDASARVC